MATEVIIGEVKGSKGSNIYFGVSNGKLEGFAVMPATEKAYIYSSDAGIVSVTEIDIHDMLCVNLLETVKSSLVAEAVPPASSTAYKLQSLPGAGAVAYLDFDGQTVTHARWAGGATINALPGNFSETDITNIWKMLSEDFRPFNLNITTDLAVFNAAPKGRRMRCIFTPTNTAAPGAGGVAYVNSFSWTDDTPCWVFNGGAKNAGEAASHEVGHTVGLSHDGRISPATEYYSGQGVWAPIMGVGYSKGLSQWSKGEYASANRTQDDIVIIAGTRNGFGLRTDEAGNAISNAKALTVGSAGAVTGSQNYGVISQRTDIDVYSFSTAGGLVNLTVSPSPTYPDLDILATLTNGSGTVLATANPTAVAPGTSQTGTNPLTGLSASISLNLAAGTYYLHVDGTGQGDPLTTGYTDYASLGEYTISGTVPLSTGNQAPVVSITAPANNSLFTAPAGITITANATDADGTISNVQFFNGATLLGSDATSPYSFSWINVAAGTYSITARATDNNGAVTTSSVITVNVNPAQNIAPVVSITAPVNNAAFTAPASITISANASDVDGTVSNVQFFNGTTLLSVTTAPYVFIWTSVPAGTYTLTARATDNAGAITTSSSVTVVVSNVNTPPTVSVTSPANNSIFTAPASITITANATDADGSISNVQFFNGATLLVSDATSPYSFSWINVGAGTYFITARATDNNGAVTTSSAITVNVNPAQNIAPSVSITSPVNNTTYTAPASITITANATDPDGSVSNVQFFNGATLLGSDSISPYSFAWTNVGAGTYYITAIATDNSGAATTSSTVTVNVNPVSSSVTLQAEIAACAVSGGIFNESKNFGFRGTGYVNTDNATGASATYAVNSQSAQSVSLTIRYANATAGNRTASVRVNGITQLASVSFVSTGAWTSWSAVTVNVNLSAGNNMIQLTALTSDGCANMDELTFNSGTVLLGTCAQASMAMAGADIMTSSSQQTVVFPNPSTGTFTLTVPEEIQSFSIMNDLGIMVFRGGAMATGESITLEDNFASGLYVVKIQYASGRIEQKKIQVTK